MPSLAHGTPHSSAAHLPTIFTSALSSAACCSGLQDKQGNTPLHLAAFHRQAGIIELLLSDSTAESPAESQKHGLALAMTANRAGILPIHAAAIAGCLTCCSMLYMAASASPDEDMLLLKDKRGLTAAAYALQQGNEVGYLAFTCVALCW